MSEHLRALVESRDWIIMLASAIPVLAALAIRLFVSRIRTFRIGGVSDQFANEKVEEIDYERDTRLENARTALREQESSAKWNKWTVHSLTFGQYIIGGILATSFVQSSLSKEVVGFLGVLVLISSLIHQRFRPDLQYRAAKERAVRLRLLIRKAEDDVYAIRSGRSKTAMSVEDVRQMVSDGLTRIEQAELLDVTNAVNDNDAA